MDRLEAMALLVEVVDGGSLSAAGRRIGVPLPTVSRKISDLETSLGVSLLLRTTRRLALTPAGVSYVAASRQILERVGEAERQAAGEYIAPKGELVVTAPLTFGRRHVLPVVTEFLATYSEIRVQLVLSDFNVGLVDDQVDMAVRFGVLPDSSIVATKIGTMRRVVCASPALLASRGMPDRPEEIANWPCVTFDKLVPARAWAFREPGADAEFDVAIRSRLSVTTSDAAVDAAIAGVGATRVMLYQAAPSIEQGLLRTVLENWETKPLPCHLVHADRAQLPIKMRSFLDFAVPRLRAASAELIATQKSIQGRIG